VLEHVLQTLVRLLAPVTPHLAEDVWQNMPDALRRAGAANESVLLAKFPDDTAQFRNDELDALFVELKAVRSVFNKALELARGEKKVRKTQESQAVLSFDSEELATKVRALGEELTGLLLTSQSSVVPLGTQLGGEREVLAQVSEGGVHAFVLRADGAKCQRCWNFRLELSTHAKHGDLCHPCAEVVEGALTASQEASTQPRA
jgi:isoleucyl-tRNA synthetase